MHGERGSLCGRQTHCAAAPSRQMAWDLVTRDLRAAPFNMSSQTAFIVGNKVFYQGSGLIGSWHTCTCPTTSNGCGATNAYLQWLAADDDNGNLNDGTPHMTAIFAALNRHDMACPTPTAQNSGCAAGPTRGVHAFRQRGQQQVTLTGRPSPGATRYWVFRTEGHNGCNLGKALIAEVTGLTYTDTQVANGRPYSYNVVPAGASSACFGPASNCVTADARAPPPPTSASLRAPALTINQGGSAPSTCTVQSLNAFSAAVTLSCTGLPAGVTCTYVPPTVTPAPNGAATSTLTVTVRRRRGPRQLQLPGPGRSGALTHGFAMTLTVTAISVAPQALAVDAAGNGVYQPNETVVVAPTWRNTGTAGDRAHRRLIQPHRPRGADLHRSPTPRPATAPSPWAATRAARRHNCYSVGNTAATRPAHALGHHGAGDGDPDRRHQDVDAARRRQLHRRAADEPVLPLHRDALHRGVTGGCTATNYCPGNSTTREQMAVFVLALQGAPGYIPPACVAGPSCSRTCPRPASSAAGSRSWRRRGVVSGCGGGNYCPATR